MPSLVQKAFTSSRESLKALAACVVAGLQLLLPPRELTVSQWADANARLPREGSPEPGQWRTDRAPYQRGMMDVANEPGIETVVFMIASQCGKTACFLNFVWYFVAHDPSPILFVMPSEKDAKGVSKERIATAIRDTPALTALFADPKTRSSGNTLLNKSFPGGYIALAGANAPRGLASRPIRVLVMDEVDGYPASAGTEGDPITIAEARTSNFWNRLKLFSSTPSVKGASRIEKLEENSDRRRYHVPCPQCGTMQELVWESLKWPNPKSGADRHYPDRCYYVCVQGCEILEYDKPDMLRKGKWVKTNPGGGDGKTAGFQLSAIYSPWVTWPDLINAWLKGYKHPTLRQAFINTKLGRTYEVAGESVDDGSLMKRRGTYEAEVPAGALVLTCGVDVQADRIEGEVVGWGKDDESWSIDYFILRGDPSRPEIWKDLDERLTRKYRHESGAMLHTATAFLDSGYHSAQVYRFCRPRQVRRVFACKGQAGPAVPLTKPRGKRTHQARVDLRIVGVDGAKEKLYANLKVQEFGTCYCHFPAGYKNEQGTIIPKPVYDREYFEQITAEKLVTEMDGMTPVRRWDKKRERNEALDCRVYAMAALDDLNVRDWDKLARNLASLADKPELVVASAPEPNPPADAPDDGIPVITGKSKPVRKQGRPSSWAGDWDRP
jgi:phage terminase large subunit GpA-like protein